MPHIDLSEDEAADLIKELRNTINGGHYPLSIHTRNLRAILAKLNPSPSIANRYRPQRWCIPVFLPLSATFSNRWESGMESSRVSK